MEVTVCSSRVRSALLMEEIREELQVVSTDESDSESSGLPKAVGVARFLKRTYGVADASVERRCKSAKLDEQLDGLRAVLPEKSKDRKNVLLDAYHYIASLQRQVEDLNAELRDDVVDAGTPLSDQVICEGGQWSLVCLRELQQQPIVDVARMDGLLEVRIACANRPGLLVDVMEAVESRGFTIMQARIACHSEIVVEYLTLENEETEKAEESSGEEEEELEVEQVKAMLVHAICKDQEFSLEDDDLQ